MKRLLDDLGAESLLRSTDEILARTMPLFEQVLELHEAGKVAPLEGIDDLFVEGGAIYFERAKARAPRLAEDALRRLEKKESLAFEVAGRYKRVVDDDGTETTFLGVAEPGAALERPVYLTRYVSWEHEVGHHDPLTDVFVLGLVLASVALDRSLGDADGLELFVRHREKLLTLNRRLHPVVARAIVRMTELDRHARVQDLRALVATLRSYREQAIAEEPLDAKGEDAPARRRHDVYGRLRDRLFDFSRRNRLLYFAPSGQTVNLTLGSVPLVLDVKSVSPDALFTWGGRAAADVTSQKPMPLGRYLRFEDYPFLSPALDQLRLDANRTKTELGYSPLRLVVCFLHWHDLKEAPDARITSPLLLLPVGLERKKGVRDAVLLTAETDQAQVNPVLRQYLQQRYAVRLPETVDLGEAGAIDAFHEELSRQIQASEPGVSIARVDKPRIDLVLAQARRRLEAYKKRVALSGRSARSHRGFDYSYARSKLHPLGVQLFTHLVSPSPAPNRELHEEPRPRVFHHSPNVVEKSLYSLHEGGTGGGPYEWAIDLSNVTLAIFQTRKMSLLRDYVGLLDSKEPHPSYDTLFSPDARPVAGPESPAPVEERFDVMPSDPTQASAVARARTGASFIIQGPPGTGKSQTITNLVADYVARGKRVLFVCEKRAAIDVVHHRLRMQGLAPLACLIHDSQTDKKAFIKDLKETYETWIARTPATEKEDARRKAAETYGGVLGRATRFRGAMQAPPAGADAPLLDVIGRAIELDDVAPAELPDALPTLRAFREAASAARAVEQALRALGRDPVLGRHPLRDVADHALFAGDPEAVVRDEGRALAAALDEVLASPLARVGTVERLGDVIARLRFVERVRPLIEAKALRLLDEAGEAVRVLERLMAELRDRAEAAAKAAAAAAGWKQPLPEAEVSSALVHAKRFEASFLSRLFAWLSPTWWRLRGALASSFDFASRAIPPSWTEILERLRDRYAAEAALRDLRARGERELGVGDLEGTAKLLEGVRAAKVSAPENELRAWLVANEKSDDAAAVARLGERRLGLGDAAARIVRGAEALEPRRLRERLSALEGQLGDLPALLEPLRRLAAPEHRALAAVVREHAVTVEQVERVVHRATADTALRERALDVLGGGDWDGLHEEARAGAAALRRANAEAIVERARGRFLEHVRISGAPADALSPEQKKEKKAYAAGRKELEHEFAKTTRYRSIRDLAAGAAGVVVRDLKPVWLMSPLSVADTLPLEQSFDVVIFDEASQIPLEDAVPAAHRAAQTIVVGDEMQLPPTDFFGSARRGAGGEDDDAGGEDDGYELDAHSLLTHAAKNLPSTMLGWHYRSRDEALIAFSNRVFYDGKLLTVPSVARATKRRPIVVSGDEDGEAGAEALLERPISHHRLASSPYEARRNAGEARYIASMLRALLARNHGLTFGVVAFSEAQQAEIERAIRELGEEDAEFRARYEAELEREEDGQHVGLFVKNLENVQGDERDVIVISVCYGPDANGRMLMNFGPINKMGGEKRLNVIFSRAKHHLAVVSSIPWTAITNEYNDGARCLRSYLRYAEAMSTGSAAEADAALQAYARGRDASAASPARGAEARLAAELRARGYEVDVGIGASQFRCNLGVRRPGDERYRLGILLDDAAHHARAVDEVLDVQPSVLRAFGWSTMTVLQRDWYADRALVMERIETALGAGTRGA